jgi:hypothetical protein
VGSRQSLTADLVTLSPFGLFARTKRDVPPGTVLRVGITVGHETFRATAVVRHSEPGVGFAVEFIKMTSNDRALLRRLYLRLSPPQVDQSAGTPGSRAGGADPSADGLLDVGEGPHAVTLSPSADGRRVSAVSSHNAGILSVR